MAGNSFAGYVQQPGKPLHRGEIALTFNSNLAGEPQGTRRMGFSLRMFVISGRTSEGRAEIGIRLTAEQWLDLIAEMKREFEMSENLRKQLDDLRDES